MKIAEIAFEINHCALQLVYQNQELVVEEINLQVSPFKMYNDFGF